MWHVPLLALTLLGTTQDKITIDPELSRGKQDQLTTFSGSQPKDGSKTLQLDPKHTLTVSVSYKDPTDWVLDTGNRCGGFCQGKKHYRHEDCDDSCDTPCRNKHSIWVDSGFSSSNSGPRNIPDYPNFKPEEPLGQNLGPDLAKIGLKEGLAQSANNILLEWLKSNNTGKTVTVQHYYTDHKPCMLRGLNKLVRMWRVEASYEIKEGTGDAATSVAKWTGKIGNFASTNPNPVFGPEYVACQCAVVKVGPDGQPLNDPEIPKLKKETGYFPGMKMDLGDGPFLAGPGQQALCNVSVSGQDMNHCSLHVNNPYNMPMRCTVEPGTICRSEDPGYQSLVVIVQLVIIVPAKGQTNAELLVSTNPEIRPGDTLGDIRTLCIEMNKLAPILGVKFHLDVPEDPAYDLLGRMIDGQMFRGPFNQALVWLLTDHAPFDDIVHKLMLSPKMGRYVELFEQLEEVAHVDPAHPDFRKMLEPKLLLDAVVKPEATRWLVGKLAAVDKSGTLKWLSAHTGDFKFSLQDLKVDAEAVALRHIADIANSMVASKDPEEAAAGLALIEKAVPESLRPAFARAGGLDGAAELVMGDDPALADMALKVLEKFKDKDTSFALLNASLPDIRTRSMILYNEINGG